MQNIQTQDLWHSNGFDDKNSQVMFAANSLHMNSLQIDGTYLNFLLIFKRCWFKDALEQNWIKFSSIFLSVPLSR